MSIPTIGTRVRRAGDPPPVDWLPQPGAARPVPVRDPGGPRSKPRPMPEMPTHGYAPYRAWGRLPAEVGWWRRLTAWAGGDNHCLLYVGITSRAGFVRWVEESDTWTWARDVSTIQRDDTIRWPTLYDAVVDEHGAIVLVLDDRQPDGARPARPDELLDPQPHPWRIDGADVLAHQLHPAGRPARNRGTVIEGAKTGERRLVQAEAPVHNKEHNEGNSHAVNRRGRILPRHTALWRRQAARLALLWLALAGLLGWAGYDGGGVLVWLAATASAIPIAAVLILAAQLGRRATRGRRHLALQRARRRKAVRR
jgi:hypothetical protein